MKAKKGNEKDSLPKMQPQGKKGKLKKEIWKNRYLYLMLLPLLVWLAVLCYAPMYGILLAFKEYNASLGVWKSPWVGMKHFQRIFITPDAVKALTNTLVINLGRLVFTFPMPIILALLITEMPGGKRVKKWSQTFLTFPHFLSWVVVSTILTNFLAQSGAVNKLIVSMGGEPVNFLGNAKLFRWMLFLTANWKEAGWAAIIYMAAITGVDMELYDAAKVDGASRWKQIWNITLPSIRPTIAVMFILEVGSMMTAGFDQVFNLRNGAVKSVAQILETYVYDITFLAVPNYGFSTAVGLFTAVANFAMLLLANKVVYWLTGEKMFS